MAETVRAGEGRWVGGGMWVLAAVLAGLAVVLSPMNVIDVAAWTTPLSEPELARGLAATLLLGLGGFLWALFSGDRPPKQVMVFGGIALVGAVMVVGGWLTHHRSLPAGEVLLPLNQTQESYEVVQGHRVVEVMLPLRVTLVTVDGDEAAVGFARPNQEGVEPRRFTPGRSLDVRGMRFAFTGFSRQAGALRVRLSRQEEDTIEAVGVRGEGVRFRPGGQVYTIEEVTENYLEVLGPAVRLRDERGDAFWVFQRESAAETGVGAGFRLESMEAVPAAVMTVTPVRAFWPFGVGLALFVLGSLGWLFTRGWPGQGGSALVAMVGGGAVGAALVLPAALGGGGDQAMLLGLVQGGLWAVAAGCVLAASLSRWRGAAGAVAAVWAAAAAVIWTGVQRGSLGDVHFGVPLMGDEAVRWTLDVGGLPALSLPVVVADTVLPAVMVVAVVGALLGGLGALTGRGGLTWGWALSGMAAVGGLLHVMTRNVMVSAVEAGPFEALAARWLQSQGAPRELTETGELVASGAIGLDVTAMSMEIVALAMVGAVSLWAFLMARGEAPAEDREETDDASDWLVRGLLVAGAAWAVGLVVTWERFGSAGLLAPMEWLGLSAVMMGWGLFLLAGRRWTALASALAMGYLVVVLAAGLVAGVLPGSAVAL